MAVRTIAVDSLVNDYTIVAPLDGENFTLRFRYNNRDDRWYLSLFDSLGNLLLCGKRIEPGLSLTLRRTANKPEGEIIVFMQGQQATGPTQNQLGDDGQIIYIEANELV